MKIKLIYIIKYGRKHIKSTYNKKSNRKKQNYEINFWLIWAT
jgi:hypothetical protein